LPEHICHKGWNKNERPNQLVHGTFRRPKYDAKAYPGAKAPFFCGDRDPRLKPRGTWKREGRNLFAGRFREPTSLGALGARGSVVSPPYITCANGQFH
jgi:hypothetical protein